VDLLAQFAHQLAQPRALLARPVLRSLAQLRCALRVLHATDSRALAQLQIQTLLFQSRNFPAELGEKIDQALITDASIGYSYVSALREGRGEECK
jgi:hypothetical protein